MNFLSLGAGVQSSVMLMMAIDGDIERPDHVLFADTGWEPPWTLNHVVWLAEQCRIAGIPFHKVQDASIQMHPERMPLWMDSPQGGKNLRTCTDRHKIRPLQRKQRELLGYQKGERIPPGSASVWIGISTDESRRAAPASVRWVDNVYPLIDPLKMSRADCQSWWETCYPNQPLGRSACVGCPHKSDSEWRYLKQHWPEEFEEACLMDEQVRQLEGMRYDAYLHRSCQPLRDIDFDSQMGFDLDDAIYCSGGCGL